MAILQDIVENLMKGKRDDVVALTQQALAQGLSAEKILNEGLLPGMNVIGVRFKNNEVYVPEVLIAARAMKAGTAVLRPKLVEAGVKPKATVVIGTVKGDLHDIGKNLLGMMIEGAGLKVVDIGIDVAPEKYIEAAKANDAAVVGVSALLTTTMVNMKAVVEARKAAGLAGKVKIMVGGAPVTQAFADEIGADGYAPDAASGADLAKKLAGVA
ncbi:MAG: corrinoid protein [Verrucomicrobiota bacterium]|nr:corrinoid protein [Verrucomicrobiota bacterium]